MEVRVKCQVRDVKKLFIIDWEKLMKASKTCIDRLQLLFYIFKCSQCGEYIYPNRKFEDIVEEVVKA